MIEKGRKIKYEYSYSTLKPSEGGGDKPTYLRNEINSIDGVYFFLSESPYVGQYSINVWSSNKVGMRKALSILKNNLVIDGNINDNMRWLRKSDGEATSNLGKVK